MKVVDYQTESEPENSGREWWEDDSSEPSGMSIEDAIAAGIHDPAPEESEKIRPELPPIRMTTALKRQLTEKLAFMFSVTGSALQIADPICGGALDDNSRNMAEKLTPIIIQSPTVVMWLTKTSNLMLYVNFLMSCAPVGKTVYAHHFAPKPDPRQVMNGQPDNAPNLDNLYRVN